MGLFNTIKIDDGISLPDLPIEVNHRTFQTKNLLENAMWNFRVTSGGNLQILKEEGHFEKDNSVLGIKFVVDKSGWEFIDYTGVVDFYTHFNHEEYTFEGLTNREKFVIGWVEYQAKFVDGVLILPIKMTKFTPAIKRSDDEILQYKKECDEIRDEFKRSQIKRRKDNPTVDEKLIDDIYNEVTKNFIIPTMEDYSKSLNNVVKIIDNYRAEYDRYYERTSNIN